MVYHGKFFYTCFVYTDYTDYSTKTEYNGTITVVGDTINIADSGASPSALQTNLSITVDSSALSNHDTIYISNIDKIHFLLGDNKDYYDFPTVRFNTDMFSFDKTNIKTTTSQATFDTLENNVETSIKNVNKIFSTYGNIKNIMKIRHKRLNARYNSLTKIIKQYCPELNI